MDIFDKRILNSCKFISDTVLQQSFSCSRQSINRYHCAWCATYKDSTFYASIFLVSGKREGEARERNPSFSSLLFSFFPSRVYCHFIPRRVLFSNKKLERVVQEPDCSELPWCLHIEPDLNERINVFPTSLVT